MNNNLIEVSKITKIYDEDIFFKRGTNYHVLNKIDFSLQKGDFVSIMGPSGSGKSTFLNCISGLDTPTTGKVLLFGRNITDIKDEEISYLRSHDIGFVFQNHNLIENLTIYDNIATPLILNEEDSNVINQKVHEYSKKLGIEHLLEKKPLECSGGERQRAAIARAIVSTPQVLICDEPTGNLDSKNSHEVLKIFKELNDEGTSIILVTHDSAIASYANKFLYLRDGQMQTQLIKNQTDQRSFYEEINRITEKDVLLSVFSNLNEKDIADEESPTTNNNQNFNVSDAQNIRKESNNRSDNDIKVINVDNSKNKTRENVFAVFKDRKLTLEQKKCRLLNIEKDYLEYESVTHNDVRIYYNDIKNIKLFLSATFRQLGFFSEYMYYVNIDLLLENDKYELRLENIDDVSPLFDMFISKNLKIDDPADIIGIYAKHKVDLDRHRYIQRNYKKFCKMYGFK